MDRFEMKLNDYYRDLLTAPEGGSDAATKYKDRICLGSSAGCLFSSDEFYAVYNSNNNKTFRDRVDEIVKIRECESGKPIDNSQDGGSLKFSVLPPNDDILKNAAQYDEFRAARNNLFQNICFEAEGAVIEENLVDQYLDAYQELLIYILNYLVDCRVESQRAEIKHFISKFMLVDCVKDYTKNSIYISSTNPLMLIQAKKIRAIKDIIVPDTDPKIEEIFSKLKAIILEKEFPDKVYSDAVIYTIDKNKFMLRGGGFQVARPRGTMSTLSNINSIRIIGKVLRAWTERGSDKPLEIAYFGNLCDEGKNVLKYFDIVREEYDKGAPAIQLDHYIISTTTQDSLFYYREQDSTMFCELQDMSSLEELIQSYDMVLFLDEGYYYKKERQDKMISFDSQYAMQSFWGMQNEKKNGSAFKWDSLISWMNWGFSYWSDKSGHYEFDENLYGNISNICNIYRDSKGSEHKNNVYVYISEGKKVGNIDLTKSNVCEEEFYYGHKLTVSHFPKKVVLDGLNHLLGNKRKPDYKLQINAWKLVRSLYDELYKDLYTLVYGSEESNGDKSLHMIYYLKHIAIVWDYRDLVLHEDRAPVIRFGIAPIGSLDKVEEVIATIKGVIEELFVIAFSENRDCVSRYVRDVIMETVKASAYWMEDFLFVNFLKDFSDKCEVVYKQREKRREERHLSTQTRQTIHAIVRQLDTLHLREVSRDGFYIKRDIIKDIGGQYGDLSIKDFDLILEKIKSIQDGGYSISSLLKHNVDILCPNQEEMENE